MCLCKIVFLFVSPSVRVRTLKGRSFCFSVLLKFPRRTCGWYRSSVPLYLGQCLYLRRCTRYRDASSRGMAPSAGTGLLVFSHRKRHPPGFPVSPVDKLVKLVYFSGQGGTELQLRTCICGQLVYRFLYISFQFWCWFLCQPRQIAVLLLHTPEASLAKKAKPHCDLKLI